MQSAFTNAFTKLSNRDFPRIFVMPAPSRLVIASRQSRLAMWQAAHVRDRLRELYPRCEVSILSLSTRGDEILDRSLSKIGGKGLFVKELENALADGSADLAVHSMKDVPMTLPEGFELAAIGEREDPRDAFVSNRYASLAGLPAGSRVGSSSLRRESQIRARHPGLVVEPLRGNVETRLKKLDDGQYAAIILAAAGLKRLGLASRIRAAIETGECIPAAGQGALGIEIAAGRADLAACLAPLNHRDTELCVRAERALSRALGGSCQVPLGAYATIDGGRISLAGFVALPDGTRMAHAELKGDAGDPEALGLALARELERRGARAILAALAQQEAAP
jgi:hydroxymethylbilane synthase